MGKPIGPIHIARATLMSFLWFSLLQSRTYKYVTGTLEKVKALELQILPDPPTKELVICDVYVLLLEFATPIIRQWQRGFANQELRKLVGLLVLKYMFNRSYSRRF